MYKVLDVCRHAIYYSNIKTYGISNLRLQKILYFIQAYFYRIKHVPCFAEDMEAWDFGPVVPSAYMRYKQFGAGEIPNYRATEQKIFDQRDRAIIESVIDLLSAYSTTQLVEISMRQKPWMQAHFPYGRNTISANSMKTFACEEK